MTQKETLSFSIYLRDTETVLKSGALWELDAIVDTYVKNRPGDYKKRCVICSKLLNSKRSTRRTCSDACKTKKSKIKKMLR